MDLYEYQARDMFEAHGVPVLGGEVAVTPEEAFAAAQRVGAKSGGVVVVKAQVKTGGRGKAGGVKVAKSPEEAQALAAQILGMDIKGHTVKKVMIAEGAKIAEEYYFGLLLDRANRTYLAMCSKEGGMDIETLAVEHPEKLARIAVDAIDGLDAEHDWVHSFGLAMDAEQRDNLRKAFPPVVHPVVIAHPETGRRTLYVNRIFTTRIVGMPEDESDELLALLCDQAAVPEYQCRFRWEPHSVAFWDNRAVQHYASSDYWPQVRIMERASVVGTRPHR